MQESREPATVICYLLSVICYLLSVIIPDAVWTPVGLRVSAVAE